MTKKEIKRSVIEYIRNNFFFGAEITADDDASLIETNIIDSTGFLELVTFLEKTFELTVSDEEMTPENLDSVNRIVDFVLTKTKPAPALVSDGSA